MMNWRVVTDWADLERIERQPWFIEPKDKDPASEERRQQIFLADLRKCAPSIYAAAVPNGGKRSQWAGAKAKREGMVAGFEDIILTWPEHGIAFIEFKNGFEMPRPNQIESLDMHYRQGHHCGVFRNSATALAWLKSIGAPVITR